MSQHMEALTKANAVRLGIAALKAEVAALARADGCAAVAAILRDPATAAAQTVPVITLLCAIERVGPDRARTLLAAAAIPSDEQRRVRDLDSAERDRLSREVETVAARVPAPGRVRPRATVKLDHKYGTPFDQLAGRTA